MNHTDIGWLAGIIDGEGCLSLPRAGKGESYKPVLFIDNSSIAMLDKAEHIIRELGGSPGRLTRPGNRNTISRRPIYHLYLYNGLNQVLTTILPFMVTEKRDFAEALLQLQTLRPKPYIHWTEEQRVFARQIRKRFMPRCAQV